MEVAVIIPGKAKSSETLALASEVFEKEFNEPLVHQVVTAYLAGARQGSKAQKTRSEVRGGGRKPWKQKGTGRARAGSIRSPIWRGGGTTFAAKPRNFSQKINKKMYKGALRSILSELIRQERLILVDDISVDEPKTKLLIEKLSSLNLSNVLLVTEVLDENLYLAARNLRNVDVIDVDMTNPADLIGFDNVIMTKAAIKSIEEWLV